MNLKRKKELAGRELGVGKKRILFIKSRLDDIKEAITKQDIRDLYKDKAIVIKEIKGRTKVIAKRKRSVGNVRKRVNKRKKDYVALTRKLRKYVFEIKKQGKMSKDNVNEIRKKIRNKIFRSKSHLKELTGNIQK